MRKKIAILLIAVLSVFTLAACGGSNNDEAIRSTATGFLDAIQAGDFGTAASYCTEEAFAEADLEQLTNLDKVFYDALGMSK
ncbi:MAG: hypothetical protein IJH77_00065, partial [Mogibacterium sp.]|nr:hypothetical protein [Mogibacterium sp.]